MLPSEDVPYVVQAPTDLHIEAGHLPLHSPLGLRLLLQLLQQAVPLLLKLTQASGQIQLLTRFLRQQLLVESEDRGEMLDWSAIY